MPSRFAELALHLHFVLSSWISFGTLQRTCSCLLYVCCIMLYPCNKGSTWLPDLALGFVACCSARCFVVAIRFKQTWPWTVTKMLCYVRREVQAIPSIWRYLLSRSRTLVPRIVHTCSSASSAAPGLAMEHRLAILRLLAVSIPALEEKTLCISLWFCLSEGRTGSSCLRVENLMICHTVDCNQSKQVIYVSYYVSYILLLFPRCS